MSFSPVVQVRKLLTKMKSERSSPRLKRFPSRTLSEEARDSNASDSLYHIPAYKSRKTEIKQEYTGRDYLSSFPCEATLYIFSFLESRDLCHMSQVSRGMQLLADDELLWKSMAMFDWGINEPFASTWRETYSLLETLFADGMWEGMSKWIEPQGYDNEQKTTARLHFVKRSRTQSISSSTSPVRSSPTAIHRVDSQTTTTAPIVRTDSSSSESSEKNCRDAPYRIIGSGVTVNCTQPSPFRIEGQRLLSDATGCSFEWNKQFDKHTSVYTGKLDLANRTVTGTISYNDGGTHWKGIFAYTKLNSRGVKLILA